MNALDIISLTVAYTSGSRPPKVLIRKLDLSIAQGEVLALIGANGAGKSSLLRVIAGLQQPHEGALAWFGRPLPHIETADRPRHLAALFHGFMQPVGFTVRELVALGRHPYTGFFGKLRPLDHEAVDKAMHTAGISASANAAVDTLSDGELQKAMIAKMLAQDAPLMVLDEPTTHLDLPSAIELLQLLKKLAADEGKTIIMSTHNLALAFRLVDKILLLDGSEGWAYGLPQDIARHELMCRFLRTEHIYIEDGNLIYKF